jgi:hypothetical protein
MPEPLDMWLGWAAVTVALLAFCWLVIQFLDWIDERRRRR